MSFNRRKNIYTLGDYHQQNPVKALSRRQNFDPFERDPFKIQSYNFRYADRPTFPLPPIENRVNSQKTSTKRFETFYYNYDFAPARHDKENSAANKFHEFRRRKFLHDHQQAAPAQHQHRQHARAQPHQPNPQPAKANLQRTASFTVGVHGGGRSSGSLSSAVDSANVLRAGASRENLPGLRPLHASYATTSNSQHRLQQQRPIRLNAATSTEFINHHSKTSLAGFDAVDGVQRQLTEIYNKSNSQLPPAGAPSSGTRISAPKHHRRPLQTLHVSAKDVVNGIAVSASSHNVHQKCSSCSGCQININIKALEDAPLTDNLTINIKSDKPNYFECHNDKEHLNKYQPESQQQPQSPPKSEQHKRRQLRVVSSMECQPRQQQQPSTESSIWPQGSAHKDVKPADSYDSLNIERHLSGTSVRNNPLQSREKETLRKRSPRPFLVPRRPSNERIPSIVPLNFDSKLRDCFTKENNKPVPILPAVHVLHLSAVGQSNHTRRFIANYDSGLNDLKNLHNYQNLLKTRNNTGAPASPSARSMPLKADHRLLNAMKNHKIDDWTTSRSRCEPLFVKTQSSEKLLNSASRQSLRSLREKDSNSRNSISMNRFSETEFISGSRKHPTVYQSRQKLSPLNVNINVFTDRLKHLRV